MQKHTGAFKPVDYKWVQIWLGNNGTDRHTPPLPRQKHFLIGSTQISQVTYFDLKKVSFHQKVGVCIHGKQNVLLSLCNNSAPAEADGP